MERYLPVPKRAVDERQLAEAPLRMLIDRVYTAETGRQVFGSEQGVELLSPAERERICAEYGIDRWWSLRTCRVYWSMRAGTQVQRKE